ncbi:hypothetical protein BKA67DRAFT_528460 [Truncatella angustata]|uniref:NAD-dependent epimerase/dehydratase domain-containing protein n=1 Tax=Truncatella angustata TaxID=152316 RepID=A0A9P8UB72_9PEZI|nr:uncharacterized protein BKA67DRAFT_528460 [Truncatella angustata]KAH6639965.1 hypothetical protein BKA67DRAFT_528460 [Truncatella angustata]KAH8200643.1 hypothetical protein TruAng_005180 [Truncatella angustata]
MSTYIQNKLASGSKLHIFVTGASGYVGRHFTKLAIASGHTVHGLSRSSNGDEILKSLGATPIRGDLSKHELLKAEASKADAVVHLAWNHDFSLDMNKVADDDIAAVDAIMSVLSGTGKPLIHTSGVGGYVETADGSAATEDVPKQTGVPLLDARGRAERNLLDRDDVHGALIRLAPYVYGNGGSGFLVIWMSEALRHGESLYVEDGGNKAKSTVHVEDVAELYLQAIQYAGKGEIYNGVSSAETTGKQMAEAVGEVMGVPTRAVTFEEGVGKFGQFLTFFNAIAANVSSQKARDQLHWQPHGPAFLEDVKNGSYKAVAKELKDTGNTKVAAEWGIGK